MLSENGQDQPLDHRFGCPKVPVAVHTSRLSSREAGKSSGKSPFTPVRESSGEPLSNRHVDDCLAKGGPAIENSDEENTVACQCCNDWREFSRRARKSPGRSTGGRDHQGRCAEGGGRLSGVQGHR